MKKLLTPALATVLALMMMLSFAACGEETAPAPSGSTAQQGEQAQSGTQNTGETVPDIDFGSIITGNGETDIVWGKQNESTKQAVIAEAKKDNLDVSFGTDGSMTVKQPDGTEIVQKSDGTWSFKNEDGGEGQVSGNWPDNEFTALIPKPDFALTAAHSDSNGFTVSFSDATIEQIRDYVEKVKAKGFTINPETEDQETMGMNVFSYTASNADGYRIEIVSLSGTSGITITK